VFYCSNLQRPLLRNTLFFFIISDFNKVLEPAELTNWMVRSSDQRRVRRPVVSKILISAVTSPATHSLGSGVRSEGLKRTGRHVDKSPPSSVKVKNQCRCKGLLMHLITLTYTYTRGRTPPNEGSARRRDLYPTTYNIHDRQISMLTAGLEPAVPAGERPQTNYLHVTFPFPVKIQATYYVPARLCKYKGAKCIPLRACRYHA